CLKCIQNFSNTGNRNVITCPLCKQKTYLNERSMDDVLKPNFIALDVLDTIRNLRVENEPQVRVKNQRKNVEMIEVAKVQQYMNELKQNLNNEITNFLEGYKTKQYNTVRGNTGFIQGYPNQINGGVYYNQNYNWTGYNNLHYGSRYM